MEKKKIVKLISFDNNEYTQKFFKLIENESIVFSKWARRALVNAMVGFVADHEASEIGSTSVEEKK